MRVKLILRLIAFLSALVCVAMVPSFCLAVFDGDMTEVHGFLQSLILLSIPSGIILFLTRHMTRPALRSKDGFIVVFIVWLAIPFFASVPFIMTGVFSTPVDAFFEAASGITTTGATVIRDLEVMPRSILLWRSVLLWIGGLGIVVLSITLMPFLGIGASQLFRAESGGLAREKLTPRLVQTVKYIWVIYLGFTTLSILLLLKGGMDPFDAVNYALSAISSGGFSTKNVSAGYFNSEYIDWVLVCTMFASGVSFALYFKLFTGHISGVVKNTELRAYILIILIASFVITAVNYKHAVYGSIYENIRHAVFQVVSMTTSTGLATADYTQWPSTSQFILVLLMFVGGCAASTSGGFKVIRVVVLFKQAVNEMRYLLHPRGVFMLRLNGVTINKDMVQSVSGFLFLYLFSVVVVSAVAASTGVDLVTAATTGFSMIGNAGSGFGMIGPMDTFVFYPEYAKWVMSFAMIVGRLEIYTFFIFLMPFFWKR